MANLALESSSWALSFTTNIPKRCPFHHRGLEYKVGSQETPGVTGKFEMAKQEMARVNMDIIAISELKWSGTGKFNSDDHYIYNCGQKSLRRNGVVLIVNKSPKCSTWVQSQK